MPLAKRVLQAGFSAGQAKGLAGGVAATVTAAGTASTDAFALTQTVNYISTAAASSGVILPAGEVGDDVWVHNAGANTVKIYPNSGAQINALGTNAAMSLAVNTGCLLKQISSTQWIGVLSA